MSNFWFGKGSMRQYETMSKPGQRICDALIKHVNFSILQGRRPDEEQHSLFERELSHIDGVTELSFHQTNDENPWADAWDMMPYPAKLHGVIIWQDRDRFNLFAGQVIATAWELGIPMISGADWNGDSSNKDQRLWDPGHAQLVERTGKSGDF